MESLLEEFRTIIKNGNYIFHIHTNYTDGLSSVNDYFEYAFQRNINVIIFTEHVRKRLSYDFERFIEDIRDKSKKFHQIQIFVGCEAKLLRGGDLDIPTDILSQIDVVCFACHSFPHDMELYKLSLKKLFTDKKWGKFIRIWVHPGRWLKRINILDKNLSILSELIDLAISEGIFIEKNLKEKLPPLEILKKIPSDNIIWGYDAHSVEELKIMRGEVE